MQSNCVQFRQLQGPVLEWPQNLHDTLEDGLFILCCEEWPVIAVFRILEPLAVEF
jgi:hypothetical protein